ncbi:MAG TPA: nucleoside deaminase [Methylomirabilota bacterium]|nr:nucleoside deaminase [Methylomirabilota bacterium]
MTMIDTTRRWLVTRALTLCSGSLAAVLAGPRLALAQGPGGSPGPGDKVFMDHAERLKRRAVEAGDQPYGAVIVRDGRLVGEGPSRVVVNRDPTAHAEMEAIRDAARRLATRDLSGCVLYATSRPCRMCEAASSWASLSRIYFGDAVTDGGPPRSAAC